MIVNDAISRISVRSTDAIRTQIRTLPGHKRIHKAHVISLRGGLVDLAASDKSTR